MQTTPSNQILNVGDYVRTSKGKIGTITKAPRKIIGYYEGNSFNQLDSFTADCNEEILQACIDTYIIIYDVDIVVLITTPSVKLGSTEYTISASNLTKLDKLTIITQQGLGQQTMTLPTEDAKTLMLIFERNDIWFYVR